MKHSLPFSFYSPFFPIISSSQPQHPITLRLTNSNSPEKSIFKGLCNSVSNYQNNQILKANDISLHNQQPNTENNLICDIKQEENKEILAKQEKNLEFNPDSLIKQSFEGKENYFFLDKTIRKIFDSYIDYPKKNLFFLQQINLMNAWNDFAYNLQSFQKLREDTNFKCEKNTNKRTGIYSKEERMRKIKYYKAKKQKWRENHPINKVFIGRKRMAKIKPRIRGKFVKRSAYEDLELSKA